MASPSEQGNLTAIEPIWPLGRKCSGVDEESQRAWCEGAEDRKRRLPYMGGKRCREWARPGAEGQQYRVPAMGMRKRRGWGYGMGAEDKDSRAETVRSGAADRRGVGQAKAAPTSVGAARGVAWLGGPRCCYAAMGVKKSPGTRGTGA